MNDNNTTVAVASHSQSDSQRSSRTLESLRAQNRLGGFRVRRMEQRPSGERPVIVFTPDMYKKCDEIVCQ